MGFNTMNVSINGESMTVDDESTVEQVLEALNQQGKRVVVELNQEILDKQDFSTKK